MDIYLNPNQNVYYNPENGALFPIPADNFESMEILLDELDSKYFTEEKAVLGTYINGLHKGLLADSISFMETFISERPTFTPALLCLCVLKA